ncbi:MAG: acyl-CoA thioesterase [Deltaproteobacteria bacterium]|nr:acyl-CoA thioesterase [Deltaproteobacteria bacterium]
MKEFKFSIAATVRINDINYGNHVGYQNHFLFFQEVRIAYLKQFGYTELDIEGFGLMASSAECRYKLQMYHGDILEVKCAVTKLANMYFIMEYSIEKDGEICAEGSTKNLCYDYSKDEFVGLPDAFVKNVKKFEGVRLILNS